MVFSLRIELPSPWQYFGYMLRDDKRRPKEKLRLALNLASDSKVSHDKEWPKQLGEQRGAN